ncbi:MAG: D-glycerate dehydrogenase, partial [Pseudomonadota bacterium]
MPGRALKVTVTRRLPEPVETRMAELFDVTLNDKDAPMERAELARALGDSDVLVTTLGDRIDGGLLGQAGPQLKLIANYG